MKLGHVERREFEYIRYGTKALIAAFDVAYGKVRGTIGDTRTEPDFMAFLRDASHRITFSFTPKHASWLNQIEIWFSILVRKLLRRGNFTSKEQLQQRRSRSDGRRASRWWHDMPKRVRIFDGMH
jgi:transposase